MKRFIAPNENSWKNATMTRQGMASTNIYLGLFMLLLPVVIAGVFIFLLMTYVNKDPIVTIKHPRDWDKNKPVTCKKLMDTPCINYIMFIDTVKDSANALDQLIIESDRDDSGGERVYYLKNSNPDLLRYIENNWSTPTTYPNLNVIYKRRGKRWEPV